MISMLKPTSIVASIVIIDWFYRLENIIYPKANGNPDLVLNPRECIMRF
jgi:hypothetical protein